MSSVITRRSGGAQIVPAQPRFDEDDDDLATHNHTHITTTAILTNAPPAAVNVTPAKNRKSADFTTPPPSTPPVSQLDDATELLRKKTTQVKYIDVGEREKFAEYIDQLHQHKEWSDETVKILKDKYDELEEENARLRAVVASFSRLFLHTNEAAAAEAEEENQPVNAAQAARAINAAANQGRRAVARANTNH